MSDYMRNYPWGRYEIAKTKRGWVVAGWSNTQGTQTNWRYLVKPCPGLAHDMDLFADWGHGYTVGDIIAERAIESPDKVLAKGWLVE